MNDNDRIKSADVLRGILQHRCEEAARRAFKKHPVLKSIALLVAQYWDDEADDAVHGYFVCSELETPDIEAALTLEDEDAAYDDYDTDYVNLPSFTRLDSPLLSAPWNPNSSGIPAFAAYCTEGGDQCSPARDNYSLYAIFFRDGRVQIVGDKIRPHLDGHPVEMLVQALKWSAS